MEGLAVGHVLEQVLETRFVFGNETDLRHVRGIPVTLAVVVNVGRLWGGGWGGHALGVGQLFVDHQVEVFTVGERRPVAGDSMQRDVLVRQGELVTCQ